LQSDGADSSKPYLEDLNREDTEDIERWGRLLS
jgi:hypothetical protein